MALNGSTVFKAGMHWGGNDTFIALPHDIQKRLRDTDYMNTYRKIDKLVLDGKWNSPKMQTLKDITRACDYNDPMLLLATVGNVAKSNRPLADAMVKAMGDQKRPNYQRVIDLVFYYNGEKTISLPQIQVSDKNLHLEDHNRRHIDLQQTDLSHVGYDQMLEAIRSGNALQLIMNMSHDNGESVKRSNSHKL